MQTRGDVYGKVAGLVGDPFKDWLTPEYFSPLVNTAYETAIEYLKGTCSPYIEKVVIVPAVNVGIDESNLTPFAVGQGQNQTYPLQYLMEPRYVDFRISGNSGNYWRPVKDFTVLPDTPTQVAPQTVDIRVRGDFRPAPLTTDDSVVEVHPNAAHALAYSVAALIGAERPNAEWVATYGALAQNAWDEIAADLVRRQQKLTFRTGSPNRQGRTNSWNLQGFMGYEWRAFNLYVKLI